MTSPATGADGAADLLDHPPIPRSALGPALNDQGYYVGRVERNLYWITDGVYQSAFLTTRDGVVVFDAPLATVNPIPFYMRYAENAWAGVKANLDTVTKRAAAPIVAKYTGGLAAADIEEFTYTTTFQIMQSLRLDTGLGVSRPVNP